MCLLSFDTLRLLRYTQLTSVWLADLMQGVAPKCLLGELSGGLVGFTREFQIKPDAQG